MSAAVPKGSLPPDAIAALATRRFPGVEARASENGQPFLLAPAADLIPLLSFLRDEPAVRCDALMDLTGYDLLKFPAVAPAAASDAIAVVYLLWSHVHHHKVTVIAHAPRAACQLPTASVVWPAALYFEREVWDLLGVHFLGHPSLLRIMCPQDWVGHPLRKDYLYPADYHGVPHLREGQHFEQVPARPGDAPPAAAKKGHG